MEYPRISSLSFIITFIITTITVVRSSSHQLCRDVATKIDTTYYKYGYQSTLRNFSTIPSFFSVQELARTEREIYMEIKSHFDLKNLSSINANQVFEYMKDYEESALVLHSNNFKSDQYLCAVAGNLVSVYRMVRRFRHFIQIWTLPSKKQTDDEFISKVKRIYNTTKGPISTDLHLAMLAFPLLQFKLDIKPEHISAGNYSGRETGVEMKAIHCLEIGLHSFVSGFYPIGIEWIEHALVKVKQGDDASVNEDLVKTYLEKAVAKHDANWQPFNEYDLGRIFYEKPFNQTSDGSQRKWQRQLENTLRYDQGWPQQEYDGVCKEDIKQSEKSTSKLNCWYETSIHPFWRIGPLKAELLTPLPDQVVRFHDIVRDKLTQELKNATQGKFITSKLSSMKANNPKILNGGAMHSLDNVPEVYAKLEQLTRRVTGLKLSRTFSETYEKFNMASYGPGGWSSLHHDWLEMPEAGGGTGFPRLNFAAPALKGSAIIWFNVNSAGEPATRTLHGSCPVVFGHKWTVIKWMQYIEQDHLLCDKDQHAGVDYLRNGRRPTLK